MSEIKKLTIHSTLWTEPIEIVELDDGILNKFSVKGKYILKYDLIDYAIKYDRGGFWLYIDDLEGYFNFNNGIGFLEIMFKDAEQERLYDKIWDQIIDHVDNNGGVLKDIKKIRLNGDELPLGHKFKINNITIVIKAVVKKDYMCYPQISLNNCTYEVC